MYRFGISCCVLMICASGLLGVAGLGLHAQAETNLERLLRTKECRECDFTNTKSLSGLDLSGVDLTGANLAGSNLYRTNFTGADLSRALFDDTSTERAVFTGAKVGGASFHGANLTGAIDLNLAGTYTTALTTCPDGSAGPCR